MRSAIDASAACRLPQCLWSSPCLLRTKTSQMGHSLFTVDLLASISGCSAGYRSYRVLSGVTRLLGAAGLFAVSSRGLLLRAPALFFRMRERGFAYPCAVLMRLDT